MEMDVSVEKEIEIGIESKETVLSGKKSKKETTKAEKTTNGCFD